MATIANLVVKIGANVSDLKAQLDIANKKLDALGTAGSKGGKAAETGLLAAGAAAATAATAIIKATRAVVDFASQSIGLASDLNEVQNVVDVTFEGSASKVDQFATTAIKAYGLSELAAKTFTSQLGASYKAMQFTADAAADMSTALTARIADISSFRNVAQQTVFENVMSGVIAGETEAVRKYGVNMTVANMDAYALSKGIKATYESMDQQSQAMLRTAYFMESTADAAGDYQRTSQGWANQTRLLTQQWQQFMMTVGQQLMQALLPIVQAINQMLPALITATQWFAGLSTTTKEFLGVGVTLLALVPLVTVGLYALATAQGIFASATAGATTATAVFAKTLKSALGWIGLVIAAIGIISAVIDKLTDAGTQSADTANYLDKVASAQRDTAASAYNAADGTQKLANGISNVGKAAQKLTSLAGFDQINKLNSGSGGNGLINVGIDQANLDSQLAKLADSLSTFSNQTVPFPKIDDPPAPEVKPSWSEALADSLATSIKGITSPAYKNAVHEWINSPIDTYNAVNGGFNDATDKNPVIHSIRTWFSGVGSSIAQWVSDDWAKGGIFTNIWDAMFGNSDTNNDGSTGLVEWIKNDWDKGGVITAMGGWFSEIGSGIVSGWNTFWTQTAPDAWTSVKTWIGKQWDSAVSNMGNLLTGIKNKWTDNWSKLSTAWTVVKTWISSQWTSAVNGMGNLGEKIKTKWTTDWKNLGEAWTNIKSWVLKQWNKAMDSLKNNKFVIGVSSSIKWAISTGKSIVDTVATKFKSLINGIMSKIEYKINDWITTLNTAITKFNNVSPIDIPKMSKVSLPRLARGGVVDQATIAMIGERGKEAVMPLENNTGWIDELAAKLAAIINRGGGATLAGAGGLNVQVMVGNEQLESFTMRSSRRRLTRTNGR